MSHSTNLSHFPLFLRLILPYERFTKGEEDKPLPPTKPRKQESGGPEGSVKTKLTAIKRPKDEQNPKCRTENDVSGKVPEQVSIIIYSEHHLHLFLICRNDADTDPRAGALKPSPLSLQ